MPRTPRIDYPGAWHHVYSRGNRRQRLFHAERDYQIYMATLAKVASSVSWRIHGYVLMPNHTHLVIETPTATLARGMKRLNESYAARFNSAYHLDDPLQGRFGSKLITGDELLGRVLWYLAMNPVEAGLCSDPAAYRWSSYAAISARAPMQPFLQPDIARHVLARTPPAPSLDRLLDAGTDEAIRQAQAAGYTVRSIASHLGVGVATVSRRLKRKQRGLTPLFRSGYAFDVRRVWIIGASGSGKTTLGARLAAALGVPYVELDALHHGPGWSEPTADQFRAVVRPLVEGDSWVIDGGYLHKLGDLIPAAADTVIWLDLPLHVTMRRLLARTLDRLWNRRELWNGNRESLRSAFWGRESLTWWAVRKHREYRRTLPQQFAGPDYAATRVERLRSAADVERLLASAGAG